MKTQLSEFPFNIKGLQATPPLIESIRGSSLHQTHPVPPQYTPQLHPRNHTEHPRTCLVDTNELHGKPRLSPKPASPSMVMVPACRLSLVWTLLTGFNWGVYGGDTRGSSSHSKH